MAESHILLVTTRDLLPLARSLSSMLAAEQMRCTVIIGDDGLTTDITDPTAVVFWAPPSSAYSFFKGFKSQYPCIRTSYLTVMPTFEPATYEVDPDFPNEAYLRGDVGPANVALRLKQMLWIGTQEVVPPESPRRAQKPENLGKVITVFSAKGGVGKTAIATNLAVSIKEGRDKEVLLVDGDLQFGDISVWLGLVPKVGITDLIARGPEVDELAIKSTVQVHESGLDVLLPPVNPATAERVRPEAIRGLIAILQQMYDFIVIDTHVSYSEETLAMLDVADDLVLVVTPEISVLRNTQIFLELCDVLGYSDKVVVVLNRANTGVQLSNLPDNIRKLVKAELVSDGRAVVWSLNTGKPFVQADRSLAISQGITGLANLVAGPPTKDVKNSWGFSIWPFGAKGARQKNGTTERQPA